MDVISISGSAVFFACYFVLENSSERSDSVLLDSFLEKRARSNSSKLTDALVSIPELLRCGAARAAEAYRLAILR